MNNGRSLRLYLVDGTRAGLITAEIMNWTGHVLSAPRSHLAELLERPEIARTSVYCLVGASDAGEPFPRVYIGETDELAPRLRKHNGPASSGGRDFWEHVCVVSSKDQNLTKGHVKYLETCLYEIAVTVGRCALDNGQTPAYRSLPEADRADMAFFIEQIRTVLPVLGFEFLSKLPKRPPPAPATDGTANTLANAAYFTMSVPKSSSVARAQWIDGDFFVLKGSAARSSWVATSTPYQTLFNQLIASGKLGPANGDIREFVDDAAFSSPSAAAAVVAGRNANGRLEWTLEGSTTSFGSWDDQRIAALSSIAEPET